MISPRVAVIGAGLIGLATALELRKRGADVVVLERSHPGAGASWGNAGMITPVLASPLPGPGVVATGLRWMLRPDSPLFIQPRLDPEFLRWLWSFTRFANRTAFLRGLKAYAGLASHALGDFEALIKTVPVAVDTHGTVFLFTTAEAAAGMVHEVELMREYGYAPAQILSPSSAHDLEPMITSAVTGAIFIPQERHVQPDLLVHALADAVRAAGVDIRSGASASLRARADRVSVQTGTGAVEADHVVLAAGAWSRELVSPLGLSLPVQAGRGYAITIEAPAHNLRHSAHLDERRIAATPFDGALRFGGTMELVGLGAPEKQARFAAIRRGAHEYLAGWEGRSETLWSGPRPVTPDGLPVIGRPKRFANLTIATGHAMLGLTLAPTTAIAVADLICDGRSRYDISAFTPDRFA